MTGLESWEEIVSLFGRGILDGFGGLGLCFNIFEMLKLMKEYYDI